MAARKGVRLGEEPHPRAPDDSIQPGIGKFDMVGPQLRVVKLAAPGARGTAHLEQVREIGAEADVEGDRHGLVGKIAHRQPLMARAFPEETRAPDMNKVVVEDGLPLRIGDVGIGQVAGERGVVVAKGRAQQQRPCAGNGEGKPRQVPRVAVKQPFGACRMGMYVAIMVEDAEGVAMLEGAGPALLQRGASRHAKRRIVGGRGPEGPRIVKVGIHRPVSAQALRLSPAVRGGM